MTYNDHKATYWINDIEYKVYGVWYDDTPNDGYDFYDVYQGMYCINEGNPYYDDIPSYQEVLNLKSR